MLLFQLSESAPVRRVWEKETEKEQRKKSSKLAIWKPSGERVSGRKKQAAVPGAVTTQVKMITELFCI